MSRLLGAQKSLKNLGFLAFSASSGPGGAQNSISWTKRPPGGPREAPKRPQEAPKRPPRGPQEAFKRRQKAPKRLTRGTRKYHVDVTLSSSRPTCSSDRRLHE